MGRTPYGLPIIQSCLACSVREDRLFCNLGPEALAELDHIRQTSVYPAGAVLFVEGQPCRGLFVLCSGKAKLATSSVRGRSLIVRVAEPASCSNPFLQIWGKEGIEPLYDNKDDLRIMAGVAAKLGELTGDSRFRDYWKFALEGREDVYIDRLLDGSTTTQGLTTKDILAGKYGESGAAMLLFRTYPRVPFYEQVYDSLPFFTDTGRLNAYCDIPEALEHGENFIVHREGPEATPYLPNVIVSSNPYIRPENYGIPPGEMDPEKRSVRNLKLPWAAVKNTKNPLWEQGFRFYCLTPKTRHRVHSQWSVCDWNLIMDSNFGDPYRMDKRNPGVGEHQLHINPQAAKDMLSKRPIASFLD